ncbi:hypothetical protein PIB30_088865, partial [Stylosanthes scabra]|nr:hypothetical protein [Stylosanthes scabra]
MASGGRGRGRERRGNERNIPMDNQAEFLATMTNLANTIQAGVTLWGESGGRGDSGGQIASDGQLPESPPNERMETVIPA